MPKEPNDTIFPSSKQPLKGRLLFKLVGMLLLMCLVVIFAFVGLVVFDKNIRLSNEVTHRFEQTLNHSLALEGRGRLTIGHMDIGFSNGWSPKIRLLNVVLLDQDSHPLVDFAELRILINIKAALKGQLKPRALTLVGAEIILQRNAQGAFNLFWTRDPTKGIASRSAAVSHIDLNNFGTFMHRIAQSFSTPMLEQMSEISGEGLALIYDDQFTGQRWTMGDGRLSLLNMKDQLVIELGASVSTTSGTNGQVVLRAVSVKNGGNSKISVTIDQIEAADLVAQTPAFGWIGVIDAPISGRIAGVFSNAGEINGVEGTLDVGQGMLAPKGMNSEIRFEKAGLAFDYGSKLGVLNLHGLNVQSKMLQLQGRGQIYAPQIEENLPEKYIAQFQLDQFRIDSKGLFEAPIAFDSAQMDLRVNMRPFAIDIGQLSLKGDASHYFAKGKLRATPDGWAAKINLDIDQLSQARLLSLWPEKVIPKTRKWLSNNIKSANYAEIKANLQIAPNRAPVIGLGFNFMNAALRFMPAMPLLTDAKGYGSLVNGQYTVVFNKGIVTPSDEGAIDIAGTVAVVPDVTKIPADLHVALLAQSSLKSVLTLVDLPPFNLIEKAKKTPNFASGQAKIKGNFDLTLVKGLKTEDVRYLITGEVRDFLSKVIVPNYAVSGAITDISITQKSMAIGGDFFMEGVPLRALYETNFGSEGKPSAKPARITGEIILSPETMRIFKIAAPKGLLMGSSWVPFEIKLVKNQTPIGHLQADMTDFAMELPSVGWKKGKGKAGTLLVDASLSTPIFVDRLDFFTEGLDVKGKISLKSGGELDEMAFHKFVLSPWFDGSFSVVGEGVGQAPKLVVTGGMLDLRSYENADGYPKGSESKLSVNLNKLRISETLSLTGFQGEFDLKSGFQGDFKGLVNATAPITGVITPSLKGMNLLVTSQNSGAALKAANIFDAAEGGVLTMSITRPEAPSPMIGNMHINNVNVKNAAILAEMLNAISVVGLVNQLSGQGLAFEEVSVDFMFEPDYIQLSNGYAAGASLGGTLSGRYGLNDKFLDMQGVISPLYLFNGVGSILTGRGEGFFSFNYKLRGSSDTPEVSVNPFSIITPGLFRNILKNKKVNP
jgi:hypothetical protein